MHLPNTPDLTPSGPALLHECDREPIHIPGAIQPHGMLLVLKNQDLTILQVSANVPEWSGYSLGELLEADIAKLIGEDGREKLIAHLEHNPFLESSFSLTLRLSGDTSSYTAILHRSDQGLLIELEPIEQGKYGVSPSLNHFVDRLQSTTTIEELCDAAAREVRALTGFDRVKVYEFDPEWHGCVVAEARAKHMTSYLGLHFPATDIPVQARRLYTLNPTRLIADTDYQPSKIIPALNPLDNRPLDLTHSVLRSVSPIHLEYLNNMGVAASMSLSILINGKLWGLIACHHATPHFLPYATRTDCALVAQVFGLLLQGRREHEDRTVNARMKHLQARLLEAMVDRDDFVQGLVAAKDNLLDLMEADGAVIYEEGVQAALGVVPDDDALTDLVAWLQPHLRDEIFVTHALSNTYPKADAFREIGSGLLAVSLSRLRPVNILWFRPEIAQTVTWAGAPQKPVQDDAGTLRLHPRISFSAWKEVQHGRSKPWRASQIDAAEELRSAITDVVFVQLERIRHLNIELRHANRELQDFAYIASHDLQEPLRKIRAFADLLESDHADNLSEEGLYFLDRMENAAERMAVLINDLLNLSRVGTKGRPFEEVDLQQAALEAADMLTEQHADVEGHIEVEALGTVEADPVQIKQLFQNLISNAYKYHRDGVNPVVRIRTANGPRSRTMLRIEISDNGIGFDEKYLDRIFTPFQRLHGRGSPFTGTGMGLAICRRIVKRHGGTITARSTPGAGSTFLLELPRVQPLAE